MIGRILTAALAASALAGCVNAGKEVTAQQMAQFSAGKSTYKDVQAALGNPTTTFFLPDGTTTVVYSFSTAYADPVTYIPVAGPFISSDLVTHESAAVFRFNRSNVLSSKATSKSYVGTDVGLTVAGAMGLAPEVAPMAD